MANLIKAVNIAGTQYTIYDPRVPDNAKFTDNNTTYKLTIGTTTNGDSANGVSLGTLISKPADSSGTTDLSLVTTAEKATWNAKTSNTGTVTSVEGIQGIQGSGTTNVTLKAALQNYDKNSAGAGTGKLYAVELDKYGHLAVSVPWTTTATNGVQVSSADASVQAALKNYNKNSSGAGTNKLYAVELDKDGKLAVNVPWTDNNTTYSGGTNITINGITINHDSSGVGTAPKNAVFKKFKYDVQGHITAVADVEASDITPLISSATTNIQTLQNLVNKIKKELEDPNSAQGLNSVLDTMQDVLNTSAQAVTAVPTYGFQVTDSVLTLKTTGSLSKDSFITATGTGNQGQLINAVTNS